MSVALPRDPFRYARHPRAAWAVIAWTVAVAGFAQPAAPPEPPLEPRPVAVRVQWGGGQARAWAGSIALVPEGGGPPESVAWRTLCTEPDAASMVHDDGGTLVVHQPRPIPIDGVEIHVPDMDAGRLVVAIGPVGARPVASLDVAVAELFSGGAQVPLDNDGNRVTIKPAPGEHLRVSLTGVAGNHADVVRPGGRLRCTVDPLLPERAGDGSPVELRMRLVPARGGGPLAAQTVTLEPSPTVPDVEGSRDGPRRPKRFAPATFEITLPALEGAYDVELEAVERAGLRWTRPLASRAVQVLVLDPAPPPAPAEAEWRVVHELDPGSPRLHERLRRMPGFGLPAVPSLPLPAMPLPSLSRGGAARPLIPGVPLPPVPSLSSMVPRLSGLLAVGDSRVEPHALGPMLRLPPAGPAGPAWEGIVVAGVRPGAPHVVEVELPDDQECELAVAVLELDADGSGVVARHRGGVEVRPPLAAAAPRLEVHRFVFWPTTRDPLLLVANASRERPALFGRVRVRAGPDRLPRVAPSAAERRVLAFLPTPEFQDFGGPERPATGGGRAAPDWITHLEGIGHAAELLGSRGTAGALVTVCSRGSALWPSACLRQAPRWGSGATDAGLDAGPRDVLGAVCDVFARERLRLVAGIALDAPLPALEQALVGGGADADGIACIGRDGRPRRGAEGGVHYNVLDPRVQRAVEDLVRELAARLRGRAGVDGVALVLPHDGWLHLPGVAWGLDDGTFGRFVQATGVEGPVGDDARFAARADLVEGPLRDRWLEWRAGEVARFHARLAELLAAHDPGWSLHVTPTTLLAAGPLAEAFRPALAEPAVDDVLLEAGLDAARLTSHRRIVFVTPHVHGGVGLAGRGAVATANRSPTLARAAGAAARRGVILVAEPRSLDVSAAVPHGPFGSGALRGPVEVRAVAVGAERDRPLAEALVAADAEVVFDMAAALTAAEPRSAAAAAFTALPSRRLAAVAAGTPPLAVRSVRDGAETWVCLVNAAAAPGRAVLEFERPDARIVDAVSGEPASTVDVAPWGVRCLRVEGAAALSAARIEYAAEVAGRVAERVAGLRERRAALEMPVPLEALDNPAFDLDAPGEGVPPGWELLQPRRSTVSLVAGRDAAGRAAAFASTHGLATLRSNPFPLPATGRLSIAAWLRVRNGEPQPPLRMALEGVEGDREYYRFAAVGGLAGGRPLTAEWSQFVLQIDDLPEAGLDSLRVRFDLLGPGTLEIDDVRVFDLAFDEGQRVRLSRLVTGLEERLAAGDVGGCLVTLDGHWPRYLEARVAVRPPEADASADAAGGRARERSGKADRADRWWK